MDEQILAELIAIKRLLIFGLMKTGLKQDEVAKALGVDQSQISRLFSKEKKSGKAKPRK